MMDSRVKSINTDKRSKKRIKFVSPKQKSKRASADVYRSYKRKIGVTSAATREEQVHNPQGTDHAKKRHRSSHSPLDDANRTAIAKISRHNYEATDDFDVEIDVSSTFAEELDIALDRNASEIFSKFHRQIWSLVRSLPEILHHSEKIVDLMLSYMLSPASLPERPSGLKDYESQSTRSEFIINFATTDILHLLAVLARDLRHEIHGYLHDKILPRIINDLLNPPLPPPESGKQPIPLDATIVEASFRAISYIFRYDPDIMSDQLESIRPYYGATLANRRELIRRLAAETFAPLLRRMKSESSRQRHLKRVLKALGAAESQQVTHRAKRVQEAAVDGISQLAFQTVRGVPGSLHSQGSKTLCFVLSFCTEKGDSLQKDSVGLIFSVASAVLGRLRSSMDDPTMISIFEMLIDLAKASISSFMREIEEGNDPSFQPVMKSLQLLTATSAGRARASRLLQESGNLRDIFDPVKLLCTAKAYSSIESDERNQVLGNLCCLWKLLQSKTGGGSWIVDCIKELFSDRKEVPILAEIVSKELLSYLTELSVLSEARRVILAAAASIVADDPNAALLVTFSVVSRMAHEDMGENDTSFLTAQSDGSLFFFLNGNACNLSVADKRRLISCCHLNLSDKTLTRDFLSKLIVALRCAPFFIVLSREIETGEDCKKYYEMTTAWVVRVLTWLENASSRKSIEYEKMKPSFLIAKSIALEALANSSLDLLDFSDRSSVDGDALILAKQVAERLLISDSGSLWAIRGVASLTRVLTKLDMYLDNGLDKLFDALIPNLRSKSHSLRLRTLEILSTFPEKYFVTDHNDLDFSGELDEDPSFHIPDASRSPKGPNQPCSIMKALYSLESIPVKLANERSFVSAISRIEVLARTGKLPVVYVEAAANQMLGSFYIKFSPIWPVAVRCLTLLLKTYEDAVWPAVEATLIRSMQRPPVSESPSLGSGMTNFIHTFDDHLDACENWEDSFGLDVSIFGYPAHQLNDGEIPSFYTTDEDTVMECIWSVAEQGRHTVAKKSRTIVPAFLSFLHNQYYAFHQNDPDARELALSEHLSSNQW